MIGAEIAFQTRRDIDEKLESRQSKRKHTGGNAAAFALNRKWEKFADDENWKPHLDNILTPINRDFGASIHTSRR